MVNQRNHAWINVPLLSLCLIVISAFVVGCVKNVKLVSIPEAVQGLERDLKAIGYLSVSDLLSDDAARNEVAKEYVRTKQCEFGRSNPVLLLAFSSQMTLSLKGTFTENGVFKISGTPELDAGITAANEQTFSWPLTISSLDALPDYYLNQKLIDPKKITGTNLPSYNEDLWKDYVRLRKVISELEKQFDSEKCPKSATNPATPQR